MNVRDRDRSLLGRMWRETSRRWSLAAKGRPRRELGPSFPRLGLPRPTENPRRSTRDWPVNQSRDSMPVGMGSRGLGHSLSREKRNGAEVPLWPLGKNPGAARDAAPKGNKTELPLRTQGPSASGPNRTICTNTHRSLISYPKKTRYNQKRKKENESPKHSSRIGSFK